MSLFPRTLYDSGSSSSFTPLFRLLDEFDTYTRQADNNASSPQAGGNASSALGSFGASLAFQPKFDVRESGDVYELHGEFPGMRKEDICIEFPQPQTLVIRGKSERTYSGPATSSSSAAGRIEDVSDRPADAHEKEKGGSAKDDAQTQVSAQNNEKSEQQQQHKYWLKERKVGEFSRTFNFPTPVEADGISAGFKDGILSVSVPKAKKPQPRRIAIN